MARWCKLSLALVLACVVGALATAAQPEDFNFPHPGGDGNGDGGDDRSGSGPTYSDEDAFLSVHNHARAQVGVPPLEWDDEVASYAASYAEQRRGDCALLHSDTTDYGENVFTGEGDGWTAEQAVQAWVDEASYYDYNSNSCSGSDCGHYTQIVWRESTRLGCARVVCHGRSGVFVTCNYSPPGNINGQWPY